MGQLELLDFQQEAVDNLLSSVISYFETGPDRAGGRDLPFVGQLKAVTGAGKTPILASVVGRLGHAIILWTTKFGSVVDQTVANLGPSGKYFHLLGSSPIEVIKLSEIPSATAWQHVLTKEHGITILVSTVASWNDSSSEKDARLNVHRINPDWGDASRWDQLKAQRRRPLWVVYDEAHNTTTEQVEQLDDLQPTGFFVASASPVKGKLQLYLTNVSPEVRKRRIVPISTRAVVDAQLLKSTISLADYDSSQDEMVADAAKVRQSLELRLQATSVQVIPKAIYVVETSNVTIKGGDSRPTAIWRTLTTLCGIAPDTIAVCTDTKDLPKGATRVSTIDQLSDQFTHIIFNKKLQEGWDDPAVYVCYFDGKTDSATRIQQVLGRALRQPTARHFNDEELNTAYFFINCPNERLEQITDELKDELHIYKGDDAPDDFEPFQIKEARKVPPRIALKPQWVDRLRVPQFQPELPDVTRLARLIDDQTYDFCEEDRAAPGKAIVNIVSMRTGDVLQRERDLLEDMRMPCGAYLQQQIRILSRHCAHTLHPSVFTNPRLDRTACLKSKALEHYKKLALTVVAEYENHVELTQLADPAEEEYVVGPYQPSTSVELRFDHAAHPWYDMKSFNENERRMAKALDKFPEYVWVRNKDRLDYGIPLPVKSETSSMFYPDFLWWVNNTVWAIDPTGEFILEEKVRTKLLAVPSPLRIALVTPGKLSRNFRIEVEQGWTLVRVRSGNGAPEQFDTLDELLTTLVNATTQEIYG